MEPNKRIVIGLTGPSSTGKTTLCQDWCTQNPEASFQSVQTADVLKEMGYANHEQLVRAGEEANFEMQRELILRRGVLLMTHRSSFITDRTPLDSLVYYAVSNPHETEKIAKLENYAFRHMAKYDAIVYTPWGSITFAANDVRLNSPYFHLLTDYTFQYFIRRYKSWSWQVNRTRDEVVTLPPKSKQTREERAIALQGLVDTYFATRDPMPL